MAVIMQETGHFHSFHCSSAGQEGVGQLYERLGRHQGGALWVSASPPEAIVSDRKIFLTGLVNSLFEGSMCAEMASEL